MQISQVGVLRLTGWEFQQNQPVDVPKDNGAAKMMISMYCCQMALLK